MPRVKPRVPRTPEYAALLDGQRKMQAAAYDYAARKDEALEDVTLRHGLPLVVRESGPYRPDLGPEAPSYFRDLAIVALSRACTNQAIDAGVQVGGDLDIGLDMIPPRGIDIDPERAAARLAGLGDVQRRDLTTSSGAGGSFVPPAAPQFIRDHFATALRA